MYWSKRDVLIIRETLKIFGQSIYTLFFLFFIIYLEMGSVQPSEEHNNFLGLLQPISFANRNIGDENIRQMVTNMTNMEQNVEEDNEYTMGTLPSLNPIMSTGLMSLNLSMNRIGSKGLRYLLRLQLPLLQDLQLQKNQIGNEGLRDLSNSSLPKQLIQLNFNRNKIGDEGANFLGDGQFERLIFLGLSGNKIGSEAAKKLKIKLSREQKENPNIFFSFNIFNAVEDLNQP